MFFLAQIVSLKLQFFKSNLLQLSWKTRPKKPEVFQVSIAWMVLIEKRITLANQISSWINLDFFNV